MADVQCLDKTSRVKYFDDSQQYEEHCGSQENLVVAETRNPVTFREPLLFCKWVASRPHLLFGLTLGVHVLFVMLSVLLVVGGYDLFPLEFETLPLHLYEEPWFKRDLAYRNRQSYQSAIKRTLPKEKIHNWDRSQRSTKSLLLLYDAGTDNIFTKQKLRTMQRIEDSLVKVAGYSDFCQLTELGTCVPPLSVLRLFDGTYAHLSSVFNDTNFDNITGVLNAAYAHNATKGQFVYALGKSHSISPGLVSSTVTRSIIPFSWCAGMVEFIQSGLQPLLNDYLNIEQFRFLYYSEPLMLDDGKLQAFQDMKLAVGSTVFIFGFILFHTRSLWTTFFGVFSIVCSFVEANLIYRVVIGFRYFGFFHVLSMFIILGIGADDLFVFWDAWRESGLRDFPTLAHRLDETYRKSSVSMLVTSLTTMMAFATSALSPLLAVKSFGVFSAVLVIIDYLSVITFFPAIVVMHYLHFQDKCLWCFFCCCNCGGNRTCTGHKTSNDETAEFSACESCIASDQTPGDSNDAEMEMPPQTPVKGPSIHRRVSHQDTSTVWKIRLNSSAKSAFGARRSNDNSNTDGEPGDSEAASPQTSQSTVAQNCDRSGARRTAQSQHRWLVVFFSDYYLRFVTHKVLRWVVLVALLGVLVIFAVSAMRLEPDNQQAGLFRETHHYSRAFRLASNGFADNDVDYSILLWLVWGLRERDMSSCHFSDYTCQGKQVFHDSFDPSTLAAQRSFVNLCDVMLNFTQQQAADFRIKRDLSGQLKISCFTRNLHAFLKHDAALSNMDVSLPWNWTKLQAFMASLQTYYNVSVFNASYGHFLDIPVNYWLWDAFRQSNTWDFGMFNDLLGEQRTEFTTPILSAPNVLVGNKLKYVAVQVSTTLQYETLSYTEHIPVVQRWERFMEQQLKTMPPELQSGFQTTELAWDWLYVQRALVDNAMLGILLGVSLALPILVVSTCNVINGLLATLTICCVTVCVIGVVPMAGWKLGVLVSLNMCLVVGLAVDYVVHLAEGYYMSHARDRKGRLRHALQRMGVSVFSGACTTLGASAFMLFAQIQFFYQFGIFMFCTIGFSLIFAMGLYVTVMGILGPEDNIGDIRVPFRACMSCVVRHIPNLRQLYTERKARKNSEQSLVDVSTDAIL